MRVRGPSSGANALRVNAAAEARPEKLRRDPQAAIETAYHEVTAPRVDMSRLIVDTRPGREHPLLQQEINNLRLQAHVRRQTPGAAPSAPAASAVAAHDPRDVEETQPMALAAQQAPRSAPAAASPQARAIAEPTPTTREAKTVIERFPNKLPGQPSSRRRSTASQPSTRSAARTLGSNTRALQGMLQNGFVMTKGFRGREVAELQTLLRRRGFRVRSNGLFDASTESAVRALQRRCGQPPTGIVDLQVLTELRLPR